MTSDVWLSVVVVVVGSLSEIGVVALVTGSCGGGGGGNIGGCICVTKGWFGLVVGSVRWWWWCERCPSGLGDIFDPATAPFGNVEKVAALFVVASQFDEKPEIVKYKIKLS